MGPDTSFPDLNSPIMYLTSEAATTASVAEGTAGRVVLFICLQSCWSEVWRVDEDAR